MGINSLPAIIERCRRSYYRVNYPDGSFRGGVARFVDDANGCDEVAGFEVVPRAVLGWPDLVRGNEVSREQLERLFSDAQHHTYCGEDNVLSIDYQVAEQIRRVQPAAYGPPR
jgi:hypothetical protein